MAPLETANGQALLPLDGEQAEDFAVEQGVPETSEAPPTTVVSDDHAIPAATAADIDKASPP
jgi:hypothetical protein